MLESVVGKDFLPRGAGKADSNVIDDINSILI